MNRKLFKYVTPLLTIIILVGNVIWSQASPAPGIEDVPPLSALGRGVPESGPETQAAEVVHLFWHTAVGGPAFLSTESIDAQALGLTTEEAQDPKQMAQSFMQAYGAKLESAQAETEWIPVGTEVDDLGYAHVRLQQTYNGLPIFAGEVAVHVKDGGVNAANGEYLSAVGVSTKPTLSAEAAYKAAVSELELNNAVLASSELVIYNPALLDTGSSANHLAYHLLVGDQDAAGAQVVFIDAHTGKLLFSYDNLQTGRNRQIYDLNGSTSLPGTQCYTETGPVPGGSPSADCTNAYNFTGDAYNYFFNTHGRDSFDGSGATMRASVRYGTTANAFWNGVQTAFGPGFATKDVVAHEWAHAVTQYSAGLVYANQSGALNESMSDIFGAMVDRDDWLMGEDTPIGALRSLSNPNAFGDPGKVSDSQFYCGTADNGGVHTNSGVPNHAAYLMADGGSYNGFTITGIGRGPTERIFYRALTAYLTSGSNFSDTYNALNSACSDLFGGGSATCSSVTNALQATEMNEQVCGTGGSGTPDSFEVDDTATQASTIATDGSAQSHNFHDAGDHDWAKFSATAGCSYDIETFNLGSNSDTFMDLFDTDGSTRITSDDDGGGGFASRIAWSPSSAGDYYIRVRHYSGSAYGAGTDYDLRVTQGASCTPGGDAYEDDDTFGDATPISVNGAFQTHNFHDAGDNDWASFSATTGTTYVMRTDDLGSSSDTVMELYDTDGTTQLAFDDDGGDGLASRIEWSASANGTYYVRVRHYSSSAFGPDTNYDLHVTSAAPGCSDIYEGDDTPGSASAISTDGSTQTHCFHDAGDEDWVSFSATANTSYVIETSNLGGRSDTVIELYDTDGVTLITVDDDGGSGLASRIDWTATAGGTHYVRVRHYSSSIYGSDTNYDLSVTGTGCAGGDSYEPDDGPNDASTITTDGVVQTHNFFCAGDNDWVRFSATTGVDYVIETLNLGGNSDTFIYLYDADGATLITSDDDSGSGLASRIAWTAPAGGTYFVKVRHYSSAASGPATNYDLRVTGTGSPGGPDAYEDDDTAATASAIGSTQADHNFHDTGDADWARFSATAGGSYVIETLNLGSRSDTVLELYDTNGTTLLTVDDDGGGGLASRIDWTAPANGTYYVKVRHYFGGTFGANTEYDLRLTTGVSGSGDSYEPDDTFGQASTITAGGPAQTHNFHDAGDLDWARFSATSGVAYTIQTLNLGGTSDTVLELYNTDATTLIDVNDDGGGGLASLIAWTAPANGTYYVKVRHYSSSVFGPDTNYDLQVIGSGVGGDAYEPDNVYTQASPITTDGSSQTHDFHVAGDQDWVQFSATIGADYVIETLNLGVSSDTYMYLYAADGTTVIVSDDDGGDGLASRIEWTAPANGTYYVKVRHYSSSTFGPDTSYDLRVTGSSSGGGDGYEPDNTYTQASPIATDGSSQTHDFHVAGDQDWVQFSATSGADYVIETLNLGVSSDTYMYLYAADGTTVIVSDDDSGDGLASRIEWTAPANGTYYVKVRHYSSSAFGPTTNYDLRVSGSGGGAADAYEDDDTFRAANAIPTDGSAQTHNFHDVGDHDWVIFAASSGNTCIVETSNLGSWSDTFLDLYAADGTTLLASDDDGGIGLASRIVYAIVSSGNYYARVRHYNSNIFGPGTDYDLAVVCGTGLDSYEPDNTYTQASPITTNGSAQTHNFHVPGDQDWVSFPASTSVLGYAIETSNLGFGSDTYMELYDTDGTTLIASDDDGGVGLASRIDWAPPVDGTYYVKVRHFSSSASGPDTNYDLSVTALVALSAPAGTVELTARSARLGDEVEATVYVHQATAAIKLEGLAKSAYLSLVEAAPLSTQGKALGAQVTADADRWQMATAEDGSISVWYSGKADWDGSDSYPALRLRWQLVAPLPDGKLAIPFSLTTIDQNGQAITERFAPTIVLAGGAPKIDDVTPTTVSNETDTVLSIQGSDFQDTPKVYLQAGSDDIGLIDVVLSGEFETQLVLATVPAGTKPGTYKVRLVNPDDSSTEWDGEIHIVAGLQYGLTVSPNTDAATGVLGTMVNYVLQVTNTGTTTDTFDVDVSGNSWPTTPTPALVELASGESANLNVAVTVPTSAADGATDAITITVTSRGDGSIGTANLTTTASWHKLFLPSILR